MLPLREDYITKADLNTMEVRLFNKLSELMIKVASKEVPLTKSAEVQRLLSCSASTLQNLRKNGTVPFSRIGGTLYYNYLDIIRIVEENKNREIGKY